MLRNYIGTVRVGPEISAAAKGPQIGKGASYLSCSRQHGAVRTRALPCFARFASERARAKTKLRYSKPATEQITIETTFIRT
jgi:hypothetical protein